MGFPDMSSEDTWHCYGYSIFKQGDLGMAGSLLQKWELSLFKKKKKKVRFSLSLKPIWDCRRKC